MAKKKKKEKIIKNKTAKRKGIGDKGFDKLVMGGFEENSINLVAGGCGSGKTIFALQFLIEGLRKKEKVLFISFEEKKEEFYKNIKSIGWDLDKLEKSGKFIFLEYSPEKVKMMIDEGGGTIESIVIKENIKRMAIDSITSFLELFDSESEKRQSSIELFDIIRKWNCTTILTVQSDPASSDKQTKALLGFEADSVIILYLKNIKNQLKRFIEILKMRGTEHSKEIHSFTIGNGGIKVGPKAEENISQ